MRMKRLVFMCFVLVAFCFQLNAHIKDYVGQRELVTKWEIIHHKPYGNGYHGLLLELTSQKWQNIVLKHKLRLVVPEKNKNSNKKTLLIIGGTYKPDKERNDKAERYGVDLVKKINAPVAMLYDVPYQPLFGGLTEDRLLAETFERYRKTKDENWPIIFPMVKSAVKAIDCLEVLLDEKFKIKQQGVVVTGPSKRGWTSWFMPVVDKRVLAIAPVVYDNLNIPKQLQYQLDMWGSYSKSISAYTNKNLPQKLKNKDPDLQKLVKMIDPYTYKEELKVPKLLVNGTNDSFWTLGAMRHYIDDLPGDTFLYYAPNAGHGLKEGRESTISTVASFFRYIDGQIDFPEIKASFQKNGARVKVRLRTEGDPWDVMLMRAVSDTNDFRKSKWVPLAMNEKGRFYEQRLNVPKGKSMALFCQVVYESDGLEFLRSSRIHIISKNAK